FGLARYLTDEFEQHERSSGPGRGQRGASPRQSADQVCRQIAADRDGKLPLYECLMRGPGLVASPPEYAALAESFCGYLLERDGPKAYRRLINGSRANVHDAAEV